MLSASVCSPLYLPLVGRGSRLYGSGCDDMMTYDVAQRSPSLRGRADSHARAGDSPDAVDRLPAALSAAPGPHSPPPPPPQPPAPTLLQMLSQPHRRLEEPPKGTFNNAYIPYTAVMCIYTAQGYAPHAANV